MSGGDKYIPKKFVVEYGMNSGYFKCHNCQKLSSPTKGVFRCLTEGCKLYGIDYLPIKTLVTVERVD